MIKYDLGGVGKGKDGFQTVNIVRPCDLQADITDLGWCHNNTVDEFKLVHTLEHIPTVKYVQFLKDMHRRLKVGGCVTVIQTDVGKVLAMLDYSEISFRTARTTIFTPAHRLRDNPYHQHWNMWSEHELGIDFKTVGFRVELFDAGSWSYNLVDELDPIATRTDHGKRIPNLGVKAVKV